MTPEDFKFGDDFKEISLETLGFKSKNWEDGDKYEGDIRLPKNVSIQQFIENSNNVARAAVREQWRK